MTLIDNSNAVFTYDAIGNPLSDGTWTYVWEKGRQLKSMHNAATGVTMEFKYNHEGIRTQKVKKVNGVVTETTDYVLKGKQLAAMKKNTDTYYFTYDAADAPVMVNFNGTNYTYVKNLQGDIVGILDASGNLVVEYKYDAWGDAVSIYSASTTVDNLAFDNPFRYRGYIWDEETHLYYLRSRYYNPEWGRFINADTQITQYKCAAKHNLFAYCNNTPVNAKDPNGKSTGALIGMLGLIALALSGCTSNKDSKVTTNKPTSRWNYNCYAYALRKNNTWYKVGNASGTTISDVSDLDEVTQAVLMDNADRGIRELSSISDPIEDNEYRIALKTGSGMVDGEMVKDYHFMRQDEDGNWSHKPGVCDIMYLDEGLTPEDVSWNLYNSDGSVAAEDFYTKGIIYFAIQYE